MATKTFRSFEDFQREMIVSFEETKTREIRIEDRAQLDDIMEEITENGTYYNKKIKSYLLKNEGEWQILEIELY